jgi:hypothetical protein
MPGTEWTPIPLQALEADETEQISIYINADNKQDRKLAKRYAEEKLAPRFAETEEMKSGMAFRLNWNKSVLMYGFVEPDAKPEDDYPELPPRPNTSNKTVKTTGFKSPINQTSQEESIEERISEETLLMAYLIQRSRRCFCETYQEAPRNPIEQIGLIIRAVATVYPDSIDSDFTQKVAEAMKNANIRQKLFLDEGMVAVGREPIKEPIKLPAEVTEIQQVA